MTPSNDFFTCLLTNVLFTVTKKQIDTIYMTILPKIHTLPETVILKIEEVIMYAIEL